MASVLELFRRAEVAREAWDLGRKIMTPEAVRPVPQRRWPEAQPNRRPER